ncbi:hypothetical protein SARC_02339 [Sphaeroforma arctica JP610]|uniref:Uncharacterized protein n=1 Tax=Sphaeroforma arctica JP610 TaxID=667725 RepID=A0A0L0G978_9EUKA|nr:hypothetical protein SARC_02339 [Sphaeroforma arctica JP610]KNC85469.1 hypothetical protein SARC_02339 [Sphaeroforma arctica JP610]|eukprot:XP_014159371.1 hypothetical protein SARC_02339 [Sphaeroforma arctica JP610]
MGVDKSNQPASTAKATGDVQKKETKSEGSAEKVSHELHTPSTVRRSLWLLPLAVCVALYSGTLQVPPAGIAIMEHGMEQGLHIVKAFTGVDDRASARIPRSARRMAQEAEEEKREMQANRERMMQQQQNQGGAPRAQYPGGGMKKGNGKGGLGLKKQPGLGRMMFANTNQAKKLHEPVIQEAKENSGHFEAQKSDEKGHMTLEEFKAKKKLSEESHGDGPKSEAAKAWRAKANNNPVEAVDHGPVVATSTVLLQQTNGIDTAVDSVYPPESVDELRDWFKTSEDKKDFKKCIKKQHDFRATSELKRVAPAAKLEDQHLKNIQHGHITHIEFNERRQAYSVHISNDEKETVLKATFRPFGGTVMDHMKGIRPDNPCEFESLPDDGWAEIVAFHLDGALGLGQADIAIGRTLTLKTLKEHTPEKYHHYLERIAVTDKNTGAAAVKGAVSASRMVGDDVTVPTLQSLQALELTAFMRGSKLVSDKLRFLNDYGDYEFTYEVHADGYSQPHMGQRDGEVARAMQQVQNILMFDFLMLNPSRMEKVRSKSTPTLSNGAENFQYSNIGINCNTDRLATRNGIEHTFESASSVYGMPCFYSLKSNGRGLYEPQCLEDKSGYLQYSGLKLDYDAYKKLYTHTEDSVVGDMGSFLNKNLEGDVLRYCMFDPSTRINMDQHRHRLGEDLVNALQCDPLSDYGDILQYLPSECYVTGLNYRLEMLLEMMESCSKHGKRFEEWKSNAKEHEEKPTEVSDQSDAKTWYNNHCPVGESRVHGVWEATEDKSKAKIVESEANKKAKKVENESVGEKLGKVEGEVGIDAPAKQLKMNL